MVIDLTVVIVAVIFCVQQHKLAAVSVAVNLSEYWHILTSGIVALSLSGQPEKLTAVVVAVNF